MKGLGRVVISTVVGSLLGAAAFFAVDWLISQSAEAQGLIPESPKAQIDKQWWQQETGEAECDQRWKNAQYIDKKYLYEARYFVSKLNTVWEITKDINDLCSDSMLGIRHSDDCSDSTPGHRPR